MKNIVLFGDSFLGRWGKKYIDKLEALVSGSIVYNCAAGGLDTADGLVRACYIAGLKPDYAVLSFGANDAVGTRRSDLRVY
jgi:lysophospholipase L1-like esterase